jgi:hypothetical protein
MLAVILIKQYTHNACRHIDQAVYRKMLAAILIKEYTAQCLPLH